MLTSTRPSLKIIALWKTHCINFTKPRACTKYLRIRNNVNSWDNFFKKKFSIYFKKMTRLFFRIESR